jgi:uncharacterized lipoprotein YmbA
MIRRLLASGLVLICAACSVSRPSITHLQLRSLEPRGVLGDSPVVVINAIELPDYLLRDELMRRVDGVRLSYDASLRWAEPLDLGIQRVLARELETGLGTRHVIRFPAMARRTPDWRLDVEVFAFEAEAGRVILRAEGLWATGAEPDQTIVAVDFEETTIIEPDASAEVIAETLSALLHSFAVTLVENLDDRPEARALE